MFYINVLIYHKIKTVFLIEIDVGCSNLNVQKKLLFCLIWQQCKYYKKRKFGGVLILE